MDLGNIIQIIVLLGLGGLIFYQMKTAKPAAIIEPTDERELLKLKEEIGELKSELQSVKTERDKLSGQGKQLFAEKTELQADKKMLSAKNDELKEEVSKYRAEEKRKEAEYLDKLNKLNTAHSSFEDEKNRVRREDEERRAKALENRDKMWAEHEIRVISMLNEICKNPAYNFPTYDNNNLPSDFDGKLKPDFMIEFLEQYIIFDAKSSKSDNLQIYILDQVKKTAAKISGNAKIYNTIFFVVPTQTISELKTLHFFEHGYNFHVISPEAIAPILTTLKRLENYEFAEQMDPQERENIVNLLAEFDHHVNFTNAVQLLLTQRGVNTLEKTRSIHADLREEVDRKKEKMRLKTFTPSDIKNLILGTHIQQKSIDDHIEPKSAVKKEKVQEVTDFFENKLIS